MLLETLSQLCSLRRDRHAAVVVTDLVEGTERLVVEGEGIDGALGDAVTAAFRSGRSSKLEIDGSQLFLTVHVPEPRIVVIGAVRISQALASMANVVGFDLTIIDPRIGFSSADGFESAQLIVGWPREKLVVDRHTAVVAVAHEPDIDDYAIGAGLRAGCFYVGALGSRRSHAARLLRLQADGFDDEDLSRIHAPIGLDIGAITPAEIAVAILAEIIQSWRRRSLSSAGEAA
ncbi:XdhC family protein [Rhizobium tumorigenes]|uniref:XdhC family protein n=1 Tax=Rhizobium tumorigenes TaxID=2041385 RepID=A0AAF1KGJ6_9HYPH|nr:XdhC family protein [Rhizobium tumorigenes]WFR96936.1 XdhC family protein [Rhizobium tumorigenes]